MKKSLILMLVMVAFLGCEKKDNQVRAEGLKTLVNTISATYTCKVDQRYSNPDTFYTNSYTDTLTIAVINDTSLLIDRRILNFSGNLDTKDYQFSYELYHDHSELTIDSSYASFQYTHYSGSLAVSSNLHYTYPQ